MKFGDNFILLFIAVCTFILSIYYLLFICWLVGGLPGLLQSSFRQEFVLYFDSIVVVVFLVVLNSFDFCWCGLFCFTLLDYAIHPLLHTTPTFVA
jgi:hypothetical protein